MPGSRGRLRYCRNDDRELERDPCSVWRSSQTFGLAGLCLAKPSQLRSEFFELETFEPFGEDLHRRSARAPGIVGGLFGCEPSRCGGRREFAESVGTF